MSGSSGAEDSVLSCAIINEFSREEAAALSAMDFAFALSLNPAFRRLPGTTLLNSRTRCASFVFRSRGSPRKSLWNLVWPVGLPVWGSCSPRLLHSLVRVPGALPQPPTGRAVCMTGPGCFGHVLSYALHIAQQTLEKELGHKWISEQLTSENSLRASRQVPLALSPLTFPRSHRVYVANARTRLRVSPTLASSRPHLPSPSRPHRPASPSAGRPVHTARPALTPDAALQGKMPGHRPGRFSPGARLPLLL